MENAKLVKTLKLILLCLEKSQGDEWVELCVDLVDGSFGLPKRPHELREAIKTAYAFNKNREGL